MANGNIFKFLYFLFFIFFLVHTYFIIFYLILKKKVFLEHPSSCQAANLDNPVFLFSLNSVLFTDVRSESATHIPGGNQKLHSLCKMGS